jgi:hypothetical protein
MNADCNIVELTLPMKTALSFGKDRCWFLSIAAVLLPLFALGQNTYTPYTFVTLAGAPGVTGTADGTNGVGRLNHPGGVAVDGLNNIYVADQNNDLIRKIAPDGRILTIAGSSTGFQDGTNTKALFTRPSGVATDSAGNLYVADQNNNAIRKITPVGTNWVTTTIAGGGIDGSADGTNTAARFSKPHGLAVDAAGNVFVADQNNYTVRKMTPVDTNWIVTTIAGQALARGTADGTNNAALFNFPEGVAVDANGNVFVADYDAIRKLTPVGTNWVVTTIAGSVTNSGDMDGTNDAAMFYSLHGLAADSAGNVYVSDTGNQLIRKLTPVGTNWVVTTLAGQPGISGTNNGAGVAAQFFSPCSVAVDSFGNLYDADFSSSTIRKGFPFAIANQPRSEAAVMGADVTLGVLMYSNGPFSCQWSFGGAPLPGETNPALTLRSVQRTNSGLYSMVVTGADTKDVVVSSNALLRVLVTPAMQSPRILSDGSLRLRFQDSDGGVPYDLNSLEVQWRTNLPGGADTNWHSLTGAFHLTNGAVEIDDTNTIGLPSCFYRVVEH